MLLGVLGTQELLVISVVIIAPIIIVVYFIYKYGKNKGRLEEMERRIKDRERE